MAITRHHSDAIRLRTLAAIYHDDWDSEDLAILDRWLFKDGQWNMHRDGWIAIGAYGPKQRGLIYSLMALLASHLARENNTP